MRRPFLLLNLALVLCVALFALAPGLDLWVSDLFFRPGRGFWLSASPGLEGLRNLFRISGDAVGVLGAVLLVLAWALGPARRTAPQVSGYWLAVMALGPGILVNLMFKPLWGRARPADISVFGGQHGFTPIYELSQQCAANCSFVSGEAAQATALAILLGTLFWHRTPPGWRPALIAVLAAGAMLGSGLRVATGRHFLSDITFGGFLAGYVAWGLYRVMGLGAHLPAFSFRGVVADFAALARRLGGGR